MNNCRGRGCITEQSRSCESEKREQEQRRRKHENPQGQARSVVALGKRRNLPLRSGRQARQAFCFPGPVSASTCTLPSTWRSQSRFSTPNILRSQHLSICRTSCLGQSKPGSRTSRRMQPTMSRAVSQRLRGDVVAHAVASSSNIRTFLLFSMDKVA